MSSAAMMSTTDYLQVFTGKIRSHFASPSYQPPMLPVVALKVMELSRNPRATFDDIEKVLVQDPMLTAKLLRHAQSPLFGSHPVRSVRDGMVRLGLRGVNDIVMWAAINGTVFRDARFQEPLDKIRQHSAATAWIATVVARNSPFPGDYAFLCGLLHDVGAAVCLLHASHEKLEEEILWSVVDRVHAEVSGLLARLWGLPNEIEYILEAHHSVSIQGYDHPVAAILCVAEHLANDLGVDWGQPGMDRTDRLTLEKALKTLRIDPAKYIAIEAEVESGIAAGKHQMDT